MDSDRAPRLRPHEHAGERPVWYDARMAALSETGARMYHNPFIQDYERRLGAYTERHVRVVPTEQEPRDLAEVMETEDL